MNKWGRTEINGSERIRVPGKSRLIPFFPVVVPTEQAGKYFGFSDEAAGIYEPHGGMMFMHALTVSTPFELPDLSKEG